MHCYLTPRVLVEKSETGAVAASCPDMALSWHPSVVHWHRNGPTGAANFEGAERVLGRARAAGDRMLGRAGIDDEVA